MDDNKRVAKSTAVVMLDVEKAFDNVWHDGLVHKHHTFQLPPYLVKLVDNYLRQRSFQVALGAVTSSSNNIEAGIPQGSILGPLLYTLFTADLPELPSGSQLYLYADDTAITA